MLISLNMPQILKKKAVLAPQRVPLLYVSTYRNLMVIPTV